MGSAAYARARRRAPRARPRVPQHELAKVTLFPDGEQVFLTTRTRPNLEEFDRHAAGDGAAWDRTVASYAERGLAFGVPGRAVVDLGSGLGVKAYRRPAAAG